ncbi:hypothetical protein CVT24_000634, partial [Panaeolus cyanescens]
MSEQCYNLVNVYNDKYNTAVFALKALESLTACVYMSGDFNCRSSLWDPECENHRTVAIAIMDIAADMGLDWAEPANHGPNHMLFNRDLADTVIDLVLLEMAEVLHRPPKPLHHYQEQSDHIPLASLVVIKPEEAGPPWLCIKSGSEEEEKFLEN